MEFKTKKCYQCDLSCSCNTSMVYRNIIGLEVFFNLLLKNDDFIIFFIYLLLQEITLILNILQTEMNIYRYGSCYIHEMLIT